MLSSETPAWKKAPLKSPRLKACVFFRKPSVLSELERSAEATTMFSTCVASAPNTTADAARVATSAFCWIASQFTFGAFPEKNSANLAASSGFSFAHSALAAYFSATIFQIFGTFCIQFGNFRENGKRIFRITTQVLDCIDICLTA